MRASGAVGLCALIVRCAGGLAADRPESSIEVLQALSKRSSVKVYQAAGEHNLPHIRQDGDKVTLQIEQQEKTPAKPQEQSTAKTAPAKPQEQSTAKTTSGSRYMSFTATNEYKPVTHSRWPNLAEPHRETKLTASSTVGDPENDVFFWTFYDAAGTVLEGRQVTRVFTTLGLQRVSIRQIVKKTGRTFDLDVEIMVKYVRREIRQLTLGDREAFLDAMETLYRLPTAQGVSMFGDDYKGIEFFVQMHLDGAGVTDCDHWHDDAGIMTHHVGYTLLFEQALQVVDPAVSIPYWEYTIEAQAGMTYYGESIVFSPDWFGEASPENSMHTVDNGRWAYLPVMENAEDYVHNAFGLLRTPWNLDSTPYVTRHNMTSGQSMTDMVGCSLYSGCFDSSELSVMNNCLNGGTHGPVHIIMGGEWNDPEELFIQKTGFSPEVILMSKYLWRKGYLRIPTTCSVEEDGSGDDTTCRTSCPAELYESRGMTQYDVLFDSLVLHWIGKFSTGIVKHIADENRFVVAGHEDDLEYQEAFWKKLLESLCDPGHLGDLFTSSAPYDPLFWVIHPTAERFLTWRRKLSRDGIEGYSLDETWGYEHSNVVGETGMICDWSAVKPDTLDMPSCNKGICGGHKADDLLPFELKVKGEVRKMTNLELLAFIYPDTEDLPYLYNEYRWDHCVEAGMDMGTLS